ncbi:MAG: hypothetical protein AAF485_14230 [Chloroflexota bacterium]
MQKWEYCVLTYTDDDDITLRYANNAEEESVPSFFAALVELGEQGWELIVSRQLFSNDGEEDDESASLVAEHEEYIFKRSKS